MADDAKTWVRLQFLVKTLTRPLIGGVVGIMMVVSSALTLSSLDGLPTIVSVLSILMAFSFSGPAGIFSGFFYPAYKASQLDPIYALRYE